MADDEVLEQRFEFRREVRQEHQLRLQHLQFNDHVPEQLPAGGVREGAIVSEFVDLADIVQERARQHQVTVDLGIVAADQIAGTEQRNNVIEQAADIGMVQRLGGWSIAIRLGNLPVRHGGLNERLQVRVFKTGHIFAQALPEFVNVPGGFGKIVAVINFRIAQLPKLVNSQLETILVFVDQALDL